MLTAHLDRKRNELFTEVSEVLPRYYTAHGFIREHFEALRKCLPGHGIVRVRMTQRFAPSALMLRLQPTAKFPRDVLIPPSENAGLS